MLSTHTILGVNFKVGSGPDLVDHACATGGLVVVPSAPVLVGIAEDASLRAAVVGADMAITDSGLMVLLWRLFKGVKLERVSGLEYLKLLLARPENKEPGALFFVMPGEAAKARNLAWLRQEGFAVADADCYVAPFYGPGPLRDEALLWHVLTRRPRHIVLCLGGGVQERIGLFLRNEMRNAPRPEARDLRPEGANLGNAKSEQFRKSSPQSSSVSSQLSDLSPQVSPAEPTVTSYELGARGRAAGTPPVSGPESGVREERIGSQDQEPLTLNSRPAGDPNHEASLPAPWPASIHCIGAAIGFLTGDQVRIPTWVDYLYLGWLWRIASAPTKFFPRYWKATRLVALMWKYGEKEPGPTWTGGGKG